MRKTADVVVIGGGVMGCSILYNLAIRGIRNAVLLEQGVLASGPTGRSQAIVRMHYSNPVTTRLAWESLKIFSNFQDVVGGSSGFVRTGYLVIVGPEDREALERNVTMQQALGVNTSLVSPEDVKEIAPMLNVEDAGGIAYEPLSGYADPFLLTNSYAKRAMELGAEVNLWTPVSDIEVQNGRVSAVVTPHGRIDTSTAVIATGVWSRHLFQKLGLDIPIEPTRHQVALFRRPEGMIPTHPIAADLVQDFSFRPESTSFTLMGYGEERADLDTYNQGVDMPQVEEFFQRLVRRMPAMVHGYFRGGWSGLFDVTPDWHPILGSVEALEGLYCAVGFSGHGFKLSPMIGVTMTELILEGRPRTVDITPLKMGRFREGALLRSRYRYNVLA